MVNRVLLPYPDTNGGITVFSFTQYDMLTPAIPVGIKNYVSLFEDARFINSLKVTFKYVIVSVPLQLAFALLIALMLKRTGGE